MSNGNSNNCRLKEPLGKTPILYMVIAHLESRIMSATTKNVGALGCARAPSPLTNCNSQRLGGGRVRI